MELGGGEREIYIYIDIYIYREREREGGGEQQVPSLTRHSIDYRVPLLGYQA
jgi:hypothetical protein